MGAYADLVGTGRVSRIPVDIAASRLVMRSNGDALVGTAPVTGDGTSYPLAPQDDVIGEGPALGEKVDAEGGARSRPARQKTE